MRISRQTYLAETSKCIIVLCFKKEREINDYSLCVL
jgi:hypothetical protein